MFVWFFVGNINCKTILFAENQLQESFYKWRKIRGSAGRQDLEDTKV